MRFSKMLIPTLREAPNDAEVISHKLMMRAGMIRKLAAGIYTYLPLALRVIKKVENIIREELNKVGAEELLMPMVQPAELWIESNRWDFYGKDLLRLKDRHNRDFCLGPTHEEIITDLVRREIKSWRELPKNLYQIQTKFRDEIRPRFGLMRGREFIMKDAYSFDRDIDSAKLSYRQMFDCYTRIFKRFGLKFRAVEAMTGNIGGSLTHEFQVLAKSGEDEIISCNKCDYAANIEKAELLKPKEAKSSRAGKYKKVLTPNIKTVEDVCSFLKVSPLNLVKTIIMNTDKGYVAGLVRGDHQLMEAKLGEILNAQFCEFADDKAVKDLTNAEVGFAGPIGLKIPIIADYSILEMDKFVIGANENDNHFVDVTRNDITDIKFADIRRADVGDVCARCGGVYEKHRGIEVGQVFCLGTKYSKAMNAVYLDEKGEKQFVEMGCYGIGVTRTVASAIEQNHDENGIIWPLSISPFDVEIIPLSNNADVMKSAEDFYSKLCDKNIEVLMDDRDERAGVKFADADLIGIPFRLIVGEKGLKSDLLEIKLRKTGEVVKANTKDILNILLGLIEKERMSYEKR